MSERKIADAAVMQSIDEKAQAYKNAILNSENKTDFTGTVYYVSGSGNDENDGKSPESAFATIAKVQSLTLCPGDAVLFERGCEFRGKLMCTTDGVTYSAYGKGTKPIINGSRMNYAKIRWDKVEGLENVYLCSEKMDNVGIIAFDIEKVPGNYKGKVGVFKSPDEIMRFHHSYQFDGIEDLCENGQFYNNIHDYSLYLYCDLGNPADVYKSIEIGEAGNCFGVRANNVTVDNLFIMYTGSHGVGSGGVKNLTVTNNIFAWIGGSVLKGYGGGNHTRYGNAVEIYGSVDGYHVCNNWIYQIYDTGITHQCSHSADGNCTMKNVEYKDNLIEYCNWSIEYYNRFDDPKAIRLVENSHIHDNICRLAGFGWGEQRPDKCATHCNSFGLTDNVVNFVIENNIFDRSNHFLIRIEDDGGDRKVVYSHNTYIQNPYKYLGWIFGKEYTYDECVAENIEELYHEENPIIYYTK